MDTLAGWLPPLIANAPGARWFDGGSPLMTWAVQFAYTLVIEVPFVVVAWRFRGNRGTLRSWVFACVVGNLLSHPTATWLGGLAGLPGKGVGAFVNYVVLETGVIALEAWVFRIRATDSWTEAVVMSFVANAVTAVVGAYLMFAT